ncbi:MAG: dienelactone hydrolase family protein [Planctomycetes bacterium]|nr:dienelactone hydrolase family protein [Planctomycetota bacterium]
MNDKFLEDYRRLLGPVAEKCDLNPRVLEVTRKDGYVREKLLFTSEPGVDIPAYMLIPDGIEFPAPAVLCIHQHAGQFAIGKSEAAGRIGAPYAQYALKYCRAGFITFAADQRAFEERRGIRDWTGDTMAIHELILAGRTMAGLFAYEAGRAIDYLQTRSEVDSGRIGVTGHSMGAMASLVTLPVERRIRAAVISCGINTYRGRIERGETMPGAWFIPGMMPRYELTDIYAAAAPTPVLLCAGTADGTFKYADFQETLPAVKAAYEKAGCPENLAVHVEDTRHMYTDAMYEKGIAWFRKYLA